MYIFSWTVYILYNKYLFKFTEMLYINIILYKNSSLMKYRIDIINIIKEINNYIYIYIYNTFTLH